VQRVPRAAAPPCQPRGRVPPIQQVDAEARWQGPPRGTGGHLCREVASRCHCARDPPPPSGNGGSCVCPAFRVGPLRAACMPFGQSRTPAPPTWGSRGGVDVFCAVLARSRWRFVRFAADEKSTTTLAMLSECFAELGGTPQVVSADLMSCLKMPKRPPVYPGWGTPAPRHERQLPAPPQMRA